MTANHSVINHTLKKFYENTTLSRARARREKIAGAVTDIIGPDHYAPLSKADVIDQTIFAYPVGDGGVIVWESHGIGWVEVAFNTGFISLRKFKACLYACSFLDVSHLVIDCEISTNKEYSRKLAEKLGFQKLGEFLYSVRLYNADGIDETGE